MTKNQNKQREFQEINISLTNAPKELVFVHVQHWPLISKTNYEQATRTNPS